MKLSADQLNQIEAFIRQRGFRDAEVVHEVLDHVACRIEEKRAQVPALDFETALRQTHAEFGIFGFATMAESIEKRVRREVLQQYLRFMKRYFLSRQVLISLLAGVLGGQLSRFITPEFGLWLTLVPWAGLALVIVRVYRWRAQRSLTLRSCLTVGFPSGYLFYWAGMTAESRYFPLLFALAFAQWVVSVLASLELISWAKQHFQSTYQPA